MRQVLISIVLCFGTLWSYGQTTVTINDELTYNIGKIPKIKLPGTLEVHHEGRVRITITLVSGNRKIWSTRARPNVKTRILAFDRITRMIIYVEAHGSKTLYAVEIDT